MIDPDKNPTLSVIIPTYNRGSILIDTIELLLRQNDPANEIIIIDQTQYDPADSSFIKLTELTGKRKINWFKLDQPSIPVAMNRGLLLAKSEYVLFLDDDVSFSKDFIENHKNSIKQHNSIGHVGQIIQPWQQVVTALNYQSGKGLNRDLHFPFNSDHPYPIVNAMAGNLCVNKQNAIDCGGFDQRFTDTAYRFESEFSKRLCRQTEKTLLFAPKASLNHLHVNSGGTRAHGDFFNTIKPIHSACNYYFALKVGTRFEAVEYILRRFGKSIADKIYLRNPWWIPIRLIAECRGIFQAFRMMRKGPIYIHSDEVDHGSA